MLQPRGLIPASLCKPTPTQFQLVFPVAPCQATKSLPLRCLLVLHPYQPVKVLPFHSCRMLLSYRPAARSPSPSALPCPFQDHRISLLPPAALSSRVKYQVGVLYSAAWRRRSFVHISASRVIFLFYFCIYRQFYNSDGSKWISVVDL